MMINNTFYNTLSISISTQCSPSRTPTLSCRWRSTAPSTRCTCWSGRTWTSSCGEWANCTSASCSPHRWPSTPIRWPICWTSECALGCLCVHLSEIHCHTQCSWNVFRARLFRESCVYHRGNYVKDLNKLGRDLQKIVIVDNSPASYIFHPDNAVRFGHFIELLLIITIHVC